MILTIDDDGVLNLPDDLLAKLGWQENDLLEWLPQEDGSIILTKVLENETEDRCDSGVSFEGRHCSRVEPRP